MPRTEGSKGCSDETPWAQEVGQEIANKFN
jgi:hypothetical protein